MTEIGQIKKEKAIFTTILMAYAAMGRNATPQIKGAMTQLHLRFITG
jgi:hypothetical protein